MRSKRKYLVRIINHIWWNANTAYQHKQLTPMMMILGLFYNHRCWGTLHSLGKPRTPPHTNVFWSWNSIMIPNTAATLHQNFWKIENKRLCKAQKKSLDWKNLTEMLCQSLSELCINKWQQRRAGLNSSAAFLETHKVKQKSVPSGSCC